MKVIPELNAYETVLSYPVTNKRGFMVRDYFLLPGRNPEKSFYRAATRVALLPVLTFFVMFLGLITYFTLSSSFVNQDPTTSNVVSSIVISLFVSAFWSFFLMALMWVLISIVVSPKAGPGSVSIPGGSFDYDVTTLTPRQRDLLMVTYYEAPELFSIQLAEFCSANEIKNEEKRVNARIALDDKITSYLSQKLEVPAPAKSTPFATGPWLRPMGLSPYMAASSPYVPSEELDGDVVEEVMEREEETVEERVNEDEVPTQPFVFPKKEESLALSPSPWGEEGREDLPETVVWEPSFEETIGLAMVVEEQEPESKK